MVSIESWKRAMFLLCGPETYDPDALKTGLEIDPDDSRRFRERFEPVCVLPQRNLLSLSR